MTSGVDPNRSKESPKKAAKGPKAIRRVMAAVIQMQDFHKADRALKKLGLPITQLPTTGAFLGRRNVTLLIALEDGQEELAVEAIHRSCRQRVEYVSTPLEGAPMPIPLSTPITVGGAKIFTLEVERYEEF